MIRRSSVLLFVLSALIVKLFIWPQSALAQCTNCTSTDAGGDVVLIYRSGTGTFTAPPGLSSVRYLVVGGGGGGGGIISGTTAVGGAGGGGSGGLRSGTLAVTQQTYNITVGTGGAGGAGNVAPGTEGGNSVFASVTAAGGGGGASVGNAAGRTGGSGGGGRLDANGGNGTPGQGNAGGDGAGGTNVTGAAGGGGGAGSAGADGSGNNGGAGGAGQSNAISGSSVTYAGGGGGGGYGEGAGGNGGSSVGGRAPNSRGPGGSAVPNTGSGGGGASGSASGSAFNGGPGGSGIVIIRYTPPPSNYYTRASGNWSANATWSNSGCGGAAASSTPHAGADVVICNSHAVNLNVNAAVRGLEIQTGNADTSLSHSGNNALTVGVTGVSIDAGTRATQEKSWNINAGTAQVNGNIQINGGNNQNRLSSIILSSGGLDINGDLIFRSSSASLIRMTGPANISLSGAMSAPGGGRLEPGTESTFTYDGSGAQTALLGVSDINYHNLLLIGGGTKSQTTWSPPTITGTTRVAAGTQFNNTASVIYLGDFINNGTTQALAEQQYQSGFTNAGIYSASAAQNYRGNFTNTGSFTSGSNEHRFNGADPQLITGETTFSVLAFDNNSNVTLADDVLVEDRMALTNGQVITGSNVLRISQAGYSGITRTNGWVAGNLGMWIPSGFIDRTFEIGDQSNYRPVQVRFPDQTTQAGYLVVNVSQSPGDHPEVASAALDPSRSVNRWWTLEPEGLEASSYDVTFNYLTGDVDGGADPQDFSIARRDGGAWNPVNIGARTGASTQGVSLNGFGQFAIAEPGASVGVGQCPDGFEPRSGLRGEYFNWTGGSPPTYPSGAPDTTRVDGPVNFNWGGGGPGVAGIGTDQFAVRWTGYVRVETSGNYQFQTVSDDGVRLEVNGRVLIDNWNDHSAQTNTSGDAELQADEFHPLTLYYYENGGQAEIRLRGGPSGGPYNAVPAGPEPTLGTGLYHCVEVPDLDIRRYYQFDETSWEGRDGEVVDSSGNELNGTARNGAGTSGVSSALAGNPGTCRYGKFDGQAGYIEVPGLSDDLNGTASLAFWIRTQQVGSDTAWEAPGVTGVEQNGGADDIFWGWLDSQGRIGLSVGNDFDDSTSSTSVNTGGWYHIVLARDADAGTFKIYVNGVLENSGTIASGPIGTAFSSLGRIENTGTGSGNYFEGDLDEVRVYDFVLSDAQASDVMNRTHPCDALVSEYRVEHSGSGLTCEAEIISVTALDGEGNPTEPPAGTVVVLDSNPASVNWPEGNSAMFNGEQTTVQLPLQQTTPATLLIEASDGVASGVSEELPFSDAALRFYGDTSLNPIPDQVAALVDESIVLRAVQTDTDTGVCEARVAGNQNVDLGYECQNPGTCVAGQSLTLGGASVASTDGGEAPNYTSVPLSFNADGVASIPLRYTDVGQVRLHASLSLAASGNDPATTLSGRSDSFVVKPHRLEIRTIEDGSGAANPGTTGSGAGFVAAGEAFVATVDVLNFDGAVTPNFGNESTPERIELDVELAYPAGGNVGTLAGTNTATIANGTALFESLVWNEVGALTLSPFLVGGSYLSSGDLPGPIATELAGRFYPASYQLTQENVTPACTSFTYLSQPQIIIEFEVQAHSLGGTVTRNYDNTGLAYTGVAEPSYVAEHDNRGDGNDWTSRLPESPATEWTQGVLAVFNEQASVDRAASPDGPFNVLQLGLVLDDTLDNRPLNALTMQPFSEDDECVSDDNCTAADLGAPLELRFGRLRLNDAYGPEVVDLPVQFFTDYWDGAAFVRNVEDSCTLIPLEAIIYPSGPLSDDSNRTVAVGGGTTTGNYANPVADADGVKFLASDAGHYFTAPGQGNTGDFEVIIDLSNYDWLRYDWNQDGDYSNDIRMPPATFGFGSYRGHDRIIYWREILE